MDKRRIVKYLKSTPLDIQKARANLLAPFYGYYIYSQCRYFKTIGLSPVFCYLETHNDSDNFVQMIPEQAIRRTAQKVYHDFLKNPESLIKKARDRRGLAIEAGRLWTRYKKTNKKESTAVSLSQYFNKITEIMGKFWDYSAVAGEDKGLIIDREIIPAFIKRHNLNPAQGREIFSVLSHPKKQSILNQEKIDYLNLRLYLATHKLSIKDIKLRKQLSGYVKNYFWVKTDFYRAGKISVESVLKEVAKNINSVSRVKKELTAIKNNFNDIEKKKKKILSNIKLSPADKKDIAYAKQIIIWHDERKEEMMKLFFYQFSILEDATKFLHTSYDDLAACMPNDIIKAIKNGKKFYRPKEKFFAVFKKGKEPFVFKGSVAKNLLNIALSGQTKGEIKGLVASKGVQKKYIGRVKKIFNPNAQEFKPGEILVTSMTRVEYLPLMRRAKAVITDEGGIACHAAVVSRELGTPCIIGTKNATKILQDGDIVEMDANTGVVKIIKTNDKSRT